jgi:Icc protein
MPGRIVVISDIHIGPSSVMPKGVDIRQRFENSLKILAKLNAQALVLNGDLAMEEPNEDIYAYIKDKTDSMGIKTFVIPGNHDDSTMMSRVFDLGEYLHNGELYYQAEVLPGHPALFLDSSMGILSEAQVQWVQERILSLRSPRMVFIHHSPVETGVGFMDKNYSLRNNQRFLKILEYAGGALVFCGHYHVDRVISYNSLTVLLTPSLLYQIDPDAKDFGMDNRSPGIRVVDILQNGLRTDVRLLPGQVDEAAN